MDRFPDLTPPLFSCVMEQSHIIIFVSDAECSLEEQQSVQVINYDLI